MKNKRYLDDIKKVYHIIIKIIRHYSCDCNKKYYSLQQYRYLKL